MPVFLRDFLFRRKPGGAPGASRTVAMLAEVDQVPQTLNDPVEGAGDGLAVLRLGPFLQAADVAAKVRLVPTVPRHGAVLRRFAALTLAADAGAAVRQDAILQRLCIVHDPNEVVVSGSDRSVRMVVVNRQLMSARFSQPRRVDDVFNFRKKRASKRAAQDFSASLASFCAGPVDLVMTEQAISGVFDVAAGLAVSDLVAGSDAGHEPAAEFELQAAAG